jgi:hypothetical protein
MKKQELNMKLADIKPNPKNPRLIRDSNFRTLCKSLQDFPEMLQAREIVIDEDNIILGGNMRYKALKQIDVKQVPVIKVTGLTDEQKDEFIIKDNVNYGVWDWDILANDYDAAKLKEYGLNVWQPQEVPGDEVDLDFADPEPDATPEENKNVPDEQVVVVEFDIADYPAAFELSKDLAKNGIELGPVLLETLKENYETQED